MFKGGFGTKKRLSVILILYSHKLSLNGSEYKDTNKIHLDNGSIQR